VRYRKGIEKKRESRRHTCPRQLLQVVPIFIQKIIPRLLDGQGINICGLCKFSREVFVFLSDNAAATGPMFQGVGFLEGRVEAEFSRVFLVWRRSCCRRRGGGAEGEDGDAMVGSVLQNEGKLEVECVVMKEDFVTILGAAAAAAAAI
jgi:hypothetical protein